jgi:hypothetical protein
VDTAGVADAGLCHGSAGNAHLFNRLWQATGDPVFQAAARRWMDVTLDFALAQGGVMGFRAHYPAPEGAGSAWKEEPGVLEGYAGVGLALTAALYPVVPDWDRFLMAALPPQP